MGLKLLYDVDPTSYSCYTGSVHIKTGRVKHDTRLHQSQPELERTYIEYRNLRTGQVRNPCRHQQG